MRLGRPLRVHSGTQTDGLHLPSSAPESSRAQPSLLAPAATPTTLTPCPSPVPQRKQRHCAKWENRASIVQKPKEPEEESKPTYEALELVSATKDHYPLPYIYVFLHYMTTLITDNLNLTCHSQENQQLQKTNDTLRRKLKEAEREVEILKTLLKRHALHTVEEDSS